MLTIQNFLSHVKAASSRRYKLLLLLALFSGLLTSILFRPATGVIGKAIETLGDVQPSDETIEATARVIVEGFTTLIMGQLALMALAAALLPLWARAMSPQGLIPNQGDLLAGFSRAIAAFQHMFFAGILSVASVLIAAPIIVAVSGFLGGLGSLLILVTSFALLWLNFAYSAVANFAIIHCAEERDISYITAWRRAQPFLRAITGSYAMIWLAAGVVSFLLSNLLVQTLPLGLAQTLSLILSGISALLVGALHITGLYALPIINSQPDADDDDPSSTK
ncbi:MAG: hypothetical protein JKY57_00380 [Kordiimonadaceae bacterium]|nr:hypothetical protein [Kordiimonadaceae bacterium]